MTDRQYEFWTRLCLLIAIASSIGFEKAGRFSSWLGWLVGGIGIAAAIAGSIIYFYNLERGDSEAESKQRSAAVDSNVGDSPAEMQNREEVVTPDQLAFWHMQSSQETLERVLYLGSGYSHARGYRNWAVHQDVAHYGGVVHYYWAQTEEKRLRERERENFVDEVVEIVKRLSQECEFDFDREHRLTIRPRTRATIQPDVAFPLGVHKEHGSA